MGSHGIYILAARLKHNKSLIRLTLASVGMGNDGAEALCMYPNEHPSLITLVIRQSYATLDFDLR